MTVPRRDTALPPPHPPIQLKGVAKQRLNKVFRRADPKAITALRRFAVEFTAAITPPYAPDPMVSSVGADAFAAYQKEFKVLAAAVREVIKENVSPEGVAALDTMFRRADRELTRFHEAVSGPPTEETFVEMQGAAKNLEYPLKVLTDLYTLGKWH